MVTTIEYFLLCSLNSFSYHSDNFLKLVFEMKLS